MEPPSGLAALLVGPSPAAAPATLPTPGHAFHLPLRAAAAAAVARQQRGGSGPPSGQLRRAGRLHRPQPTGRRPGQGDRPATGAARAGQRRPEPAAAAPALRHARDRPDQPGTARRVGRDRRAGRRGGPEMPGKPGANAACARADLPGRQGPGVPQRLPGPVAQGPAGGRAVPRRQEGQRGQRQPAATQSPARTRRSGPRLRGRSSGPCGGSCAETRTG